MSEHMTRRAALAASATGALGVLGLAACSEESAFEDRWRELGMTPERVSAGQLELLTVDPAPAAETPDSIYLVESSALFPSFTKDQVDTLLGGNASPEEGITAPEGMTFLVARTRRDPLEEKTWSSAGQVVVTCRIPASEESDAHVAKVLNPADVDEAWLLRVPADPAPQDALLELEIDGKIQQLSLVDGSLVRDDLAYLEGRRRGLTLQAAVEVESTPLFEAETLDGDEAKDALSFYAGDCLLAPMTASQGWPTPGTQLAGIAISPEQYYEPAATDETMHLPARPEGCTLTLPDGTVIEQRTAEVSRRDIVNGTFEGAAYIVWFEVPCDLDSATAHLQVTPCPRREDLAEALGTSDGADVTLTFTQDPA